jgi:hypothetical protein
MDLASEGIDGAWDPARQRGLNTKGTTIVFFLGLTKPLPSYPMNRQARTGDTVLVKRIER